MDDIRKAIQARHENIANTFEKGKKVPIGTITNGRKKVAEGVWVIAKRASGPIKPKVGMVGTIGRNKRRVRVTGVDASGTVSFEDLSDSKQKLTSVGSRVFDMDFSLEKEE
jgi:hypothetical protein